MNFIAIDVETANADMASVCALGLVHFKDGQVFRDLSVLIDPQDEFDPINVSIHGIRPEDVVGKPTIDKVYPALATNLDGCVLIHHTHFDKTAFQRIAERNNYQELPCNWLDSSRIARRAWSDCARRGFGLADLAQRLDISFRHHDAAEDARCAGLIVVRAIVETGTPLEEWFARVEGPIFGQGRIVREGNPDGPLFGEVMTFTGSLSVDRATAAEWASNAGCEVAAAVTKRTTILVIGDQDIRALNGATISAKRRKALDLMQKGASIRIVPEVDFRALVGQNR